MTYNSFMNKDHESKFVFTNSSNNLINRIYNQTASPLKIKQAVTEGQNGGSNLAEENQQVNGNVNNGLLGNQMSNQNILKDGNKCVLCSEEVERRYQEYQSLASTIEEKFNALIGFQITKIQTEKTQNEKTKLLSLSDIKHTLGQLSEAQLGTERIKFTKKGMSLYELDKLKRIQIFDLSSLLKGDNDKENKSKVTSIDIFRKIEAAKEASHSLRFNAQIELIKNLDYLELLNHIKKVAKNGDNQNCDNKTLDDIKEEWKSLQVRSNSLVHHSNFSENGKEHKQRSSKRGSDLSPLVEVIEDQLDDKGSVFQNTSELHPKLNFINGDLSDDSNTYTHNTKGYRKHSNAGNDEEHPTPIKALSKMSFRPAIKSQSGLEIDTRFLNLITSDVKDKKYNDSKSKEILNSNQRKEKSYFMTVIGNHQVNNSEASATTNSNTNQTSSDFNYINSSIKQSLGKPSGPGNLKKKGSIELPNVDLSKEEEFNKKVNYYKQYRHDISNGVISFNKAKSKEKGLHEKTSLKEYIHNDIKEDTYNVMENIQIERQLEREINLLKEEKQSLDSCTIQVYAEINKLRDKLDKLKSEKSFLIMMKEKQESEINAVLSGNTQNSYPNRGKRSENSIVSHKKTVSFDSDKYVELAEKKKRFMQFRKEYEDKMKDLNASLQSAEDLLSIKKDEVSILLQKEKIVKEELSNAKSTLLLYYHKILSIGVDVRKNGLQWIIISIWKLDSNVVLSYLPNFLDKENCIYLFLTSHILIILELFHKLLHEIKVFIKTAKQSLSQILITETTTDSIKLKNKLSKQTTYIKFASDFVKGVSTTQINLHPDNNPINFAGIKDDLIEITRPKIERDDTNQAIEAANDDNRDRKAILSLLQIKSSKYLPSLRPNVQLSKSMDMTKVESNFRKKSILNGKPIPDKYSLNEFEPSAANAHHQYMSLKKNKYQMKNTNMSTSGNQAHSYLERESNFSVNSVQKLLKTEELKVKSVLNSTSLKKLVDLVFTIEKIIVRINTILSNVKRREVARMLEVFCSNYSYDATQNENLSYIFKGLFGLSGYSQELTYISKELDVYRNNINMTRMTDTDKPLVSSSYLNSNYS